MFMQSSPWPACRSVVTDRRSWAGTVEGGGSLAGALEGLVLVEGYVDRYRADTVAAALEAWGISALVVPDPVNGRNLGSVYNPTPPGSALFGVLVREPELALARDILERTMVDLPEEFVGDQAEEWADEVTADRHDRRRWIRRAVMAVIIGFFAFWMAIALVASLAGGPP